MSRLRRRTDTGAALVEFAILLPFIALLVCGVIGIGRLYGSWNEAKNAAREGAIYAQVLPNQQGNYGGACASPNNVEARVKQELGNAAVSGTFTVTVTPTVWTCNPAVGGIKAPANITVTVTRQMNLITPIIRNLLGTTTVRAKVTSAVQG